MGKTINQNEKRKELKKDKNNNRYTSVLGDT